MALAHALIFSLGLSLQLGVVYFLQTQKKGPPYDNLCWNFTYCTAHNTVISILSMTPSIFHFFCESQSVNCHNSKPFSRPEFECSWMNITSSLAISFPRVWWKLTKLRLWWSMEKMIQNNYIEVSKLLTLIGTPNFFLFLCTIIAYDHIKFYCLNRYLTNTIVHLLLNFHFHWSDGPLWTQKFIFSVSLTTSKISTVVANWI